VAVVDAKSDRYVVISADTHGGARVEAYRDYVDQRFRADFDGWVVGFRQRVEGFRNRVDDVLREAVEDPDALRTFHQLMDSGLGDPKERLRTLESDGCVASVIFPATDIDTLPPFDAMPVLGAPAPSRAHRWAGARAYNRWLSEYCSEDNGRLGGMLVLPDLDDIDEAVAEIRWGAAMGLRGGVNLPSWNVDFPAFHHPRYDPLWATCAELRMPINIHVGNHGADPRLYGNVSSAGMIAAAEATWWARRPLTLLIFGGVFERHPGLRLVFAEMHADWIPNLLEHLESVFHRRLNATLCRGLSLTPREYWERNCGVTATFMTPHEAELRHQIGVANIMWGSDFPHPEGTYPFTRECLRRTFNRVPPAETQAILADNAARLYNLDLPRLRALASRVGPPVEEVAAPLTDIPLGFRQFAVALQVEDVTDASSTLGGPRE
jgi:predicted TIM-barrel fold metal-dependent hydrolase